jgi:hypothetical protein
MDDNVIYLPEEDFPNAERFKLTKEFSREEIPDVPLVMKNFPENAPMVVKGFGFVSEHTYSNIINEIDESLLQFEMPMYIIGVDKVENVFTVIDKLNSIENDDDVFIQNQANGLRAEGLSLYEVERPSMLEERKNAFETQVYRCV